MHGSVLDHVPHDYSGPSETVRLVRPWPHHFFRDLAQFVLPTKLVFKIRVHCWVFRVVRSATAASYIRAASCGAVTCHAYSTPLHMRIRNALYTRA